MENCISCAARSNSLVYTFTLLLTDFKIPEAYLEHSRTSMIELFRINNYTLFFISNTLISNARRKMAKNQANAKEHLEAELWLFEN